ncbi:MAG: phosphate signaling complex PhoU family protein [Candidatus Thorarchaeota archaeon]|jgi:phosphate transport system protein
MTSEIDHVITEISERLRTLHRHVTNALVQSMKAFEDLDEECATQAESITEDIAQIHASIEDTIFEAIAKHQPTDFNLRKLVAFVQASGSLHRVGRYANKVTAIVHMSQDLEHFKELESLPYLTELAETSLDIAMRAVLESDISELEELEKLEAQSDVETAEMFEEIADFLTRRRDISEIAMYYIIVGRYCERAADHALLIAEAAYYLVTGERKKLGLVHEDEQPKSLLD